MNVIKPDKQLVAARIKSIKEGLGLSFTEMGRELGGLPKTTVSSWARGLALPPKDIVSKLAEISGMSETWILHGVEKEELAKMIVLKQHEDILDLIKLDYFISYSYRDANGVLHISNTNIQNKLINNYDKLKEVEEQIKFLESNDTVRIISFKEF